MSEEQAKVSVGRMRVAIVTAGLVSANEAQNLTNAQIRTYYSQLSGETAEHESGGGGDVDGRGGGGGGDSDHASGQEHTPSIRKLMAPPLRATITSKALQEAVDRVIASSPEMGQLVRQALEAMNANGELREGLGVQEYIDQAMGRIQAALAAGNKEQQESLLEWMQQVEERATTRLVVELPEVPHLEIEDQHYMFADLLFNAAMRIPTLATGPTGSGKTTAAMKIAEVLKMRFSYVALGPSMPESRLSGGTNANGELVPTEFYLWYRYGGVLALDEMDAANPSVLLWINGAIQNKVGSFPRGYMTRIEYEEFAQPAGVVEGEFQPHSIPTGGIVEMHPDAVLVASANTYGKGADMMYVGRQPIDAATFKRFKFLTWEYDEKLERKLSPLDPWTDLVQAVRACVFARSMPHAVSPVDSIDGGKMILAGKSWEQVAKETIFAGLKSHEIDRIANDEKHAARIQKAMKAMRDWSKARAQKREKSQASKAKAQGEEQQRQEAVAGD